MSFAWAEPYPELYRICVLFERTDLLNPEISKYRPLQSYLQKGPQCGLVALAMVMGNPTTETVNKIYEHAKEKGYTYNGEIFSANYMLNLAKEFLTHTFVELYTGSLNAYKIKEFLIRGGVLLVPYDTAKDNSPGCFNGHKAHWCAVSGAAKTGEDFFVFAKHGKAKNVGIWNISDLATSNQQLFEFAPDRKLHDITYKLPEGGIAGPLGLNSKCILIRDKIL